MSRLVLVLAALLALPALPALAVDEHPLCAARCDPRTSAMADLPLEEVQTIQGYALARLRHLVRCGVVWSAPMDEWTWTLPKPPVYFCSHEIPVGTICAHSVVANSDDGMGAIVISLARPEVVRELLAGETANWAMVYLMGNWGEELDGPAVWSLIAPWVNRQLYLDTTGTPAKTEPSGEGR